MTKATNGEEITTLDFLTSIIQKSRISFLGALESFERQSEDYQKVLAQAIAERDQYEINSWVGKIAKWQNIRLASEILGDLILRLEDNPFPGKRCRFFRVCVELYPRLELKHTGRGKMVWNWIFEEFRLPRDYYIVFPEKAEVVDVEEVERELLKLAGANNVVTVESAKSVLVWSPKSKIYKVVRCALEERGWAWKVRRVGSKTERVICAPKMLHSR